MLLLRVHGHPPWKYPALLHLRGFFSLSYYFFKSVRRGGGIGSSVRRSLEDDAVAFRVTGIVEADDAAGIDCQDRTAEMR